MHCVRSETICCCGNLHNLLHLYSKKHFQQNRWHARKQKKEEQHTSLGVHKILRTRSMPAVPDEHIRKYLHSRWIKVTIATKTLTVRVPSKWFIAYSFQPQQKKKETSLSSIHSRLYWRHRSIKKKRKTGTYLSKKGLANCNKSDTILTNIAGMISHLKSTNKRHIIDGGFGISGASCSSTAVKS